MQQPLRRLRRDEAGLSAVEFALVAPVLAFALVASVDLGLAQYERMTIDQAMRAGAQRAIADPGGAAILSTTRGTITKNFSIATSPGSSATAVNVDVQRFCTCPESITAAVACSTTCSGSAPTFVFYRLTGTKLYKGMILPQFVLRSAALVQVR